MAYAASQKEHHQRQQKQWEDMMEKLKQKHQRNIADTISLTYDYRPNPGDISPTTQKVNIDQIKLQSLPFIRVSRVKVIEDVNSQPNSNKNGLDIV